uniref:Uncharacterized protein n=1 Tax=Globisporangium ultimum (strain ATCC 200006 / CBS 805.95 / DAOM BR144) TaxID=431595 RepID=K3W664_GLOUD
MNRTAEKVEIAQRLSYLSNASHAKDGDYEGAKTPDVLEAQDGAIRAGGAPNLLSKDHIGLILQYAAVGIVYGVMPATIYPFLQSYLNASGTQIVTAGTLVVLPWSFKIFYGIVSDCFPIFGYRRRPYMLLGWERRPLDRMDITKVGDLMYGMTIISWFFLILLPKQKAETQELKRTGGSSKILGAITVFYVFFAFVWSVMTNVMGIFESTACLVIAGGDGC